MKCLILAAGYATRLYPLTENFPKPLLKVGEKSILDWLADDLVDTTDIDEFVVISNHKFAQHFEDWKSNKQKTRPYEITVIDDGTSTNETRLGAVKDIQLAVEKLKLADDLRLRRMAAVYEQQLELCERHQQERELSMLQLRDIKHNMKNNLISILAYAENKEYEKMTGFIEEIMGEGGMVIASISNSGNIVIDSLIGYWYVTAQNKRIIFKTDICIPMIMPFKGADLSLILGNLLENAVEAAEKVEENRYINVKMKFDKNNLLLFVDNSYKGKLLKTRDNRLKSTKSDAENHGVGLASVYRAVAKYHGSVVIEDSEPGKFKIRIVLYSNVQE